MCFRGLSSKTFGTFLTTYVHFVAEGDAGELHPFFILAFVLHLREWKPGDLQPAASEGVQAGDGGDEAFVFSAAADNQEDLR